MQEALPARPFSPPCPLPCSTLPPLPDTAPSPPPPPHPHNPPPLPLMSLCVQVELFAEGDEVNELYFIVAGYVEVFASASAAEQSDKESL